jgi:predicted TIM-barrel fold metal-dependent hydrolase
VRLIALEEHYQAPMVKQLTSEYQWHVDPDTPQGKQLAKVDGVGEERLVDMDRAGIDVQVLSHTVPSTELLSATEAVWAAGAANEYLADAIGAHPDRFAAFATLPTGAPEAAADELERTVTQHGFKGAMINGQTDGRFLDDRFHWPTLARAERLEVPIYLHPGPPPPAVSAAYYDNLPPGAGETLATAGWGWHVDTGLHALRLIVGGVFDEFPRLQVILGHMGEALPFFLARSSQHLVRAGLVDRPLADYVEHNFHFTTSGMFTDAPLLCLLSVAGADRVMFSVDYPFSTNEEAVGFLDAAPISAADREKIAHGNAERLMGL